MMLSACEDPATEIGADLLPNGDLISANFTDTISIKASTVLLDSIVTSSTDKVLVGRYIDPIFGTVTASGYFQITNVDSIRADANTVLDSVVLSLGYKYNIGDTTVPQSISVHRILDKIGQNTGSLTKRLLESLDAKNTYYNYDRANYDPTPIGTTGQFFARPIIKKRTIDSQLDSMRSLNIRLNESFGKELLSLSGKKAGAGLVNFKEYIKGIVLVPGANDNASILGFEPTNTPSTRRLRPSYMGLYYHTKGKTDTLRTFFFVSFTSNEAYNNRFNNISVDRAGTVMSSLRLPNQTLESQYSNKEIYIQSSTGLAAKLDFPSLKNLVKNGNVAVNKVELIISPIKLVTGTFPVIPLNLILVNPLDKKRPLRTPTGELSALATESGLAAQTAVFNSTKQEYVFNITSHFNSILLGKTENNGLYLTAGNDFRVNRLVADKNTIKLRVHYSKQGK